VGAIERLKKAHRPRAESSGAVEYEGEVLRSLSEGHKPDCTPAIRLDGHKGFLDMDFVEHLFHALW
jgi:hypothetical protein